MDASTAERVRQQPPPLSATPSFPSAPNHPHVKRARFVSVKTALLVSAASGVEAIPPTFCEAQIGMGVGGWGVTANGRASSTFTVRRNYKCETWPKTEVHQKIKVSLSLAKKERARALHYATAARGKIMSSGCFLCVDKHCILHLATVTVPAPISEIFTEVRHQAAKEYRILMTYQHKAARTLRYATAVSGDRVLSPFAILHLCWAVMPVVPDTKEESVRPPKYLVTAAVPRRANSSSPASLRTNGKTES